MGNDIVFAGFPAAGIKFLKQIRTNNNREWFEENKQTYKQELEAPAKVFLDEMADHLSELSGKMMDGKLYRFYRDVRFSKDKTPYNTHIRMSFFEMDSQMKACGDRPAFHFSLDADKVITGLGCFEFSKDMLVIYQSAVADAKSGDALEKTAAGLVKKGFRLDGDEYKRVPKPFEQDHPRGNLLRRKGITIWTHELSPKEMSERKGISHCMKQYKIMMPIFQWLNGLN